MRKCVCRARRQVLVVDTAVAVKMGNAPSGKTDVGELRRPARREKKVLLACNWQGLCLCPVGTIVWEYPIMSNACVCVYQIRILPSGVKHSDSSLDNTIQSTWIMGGTQRPPLGT